MIAVVLPLPSIHMVETSQDDDTRDLNGATLSLALQEHVLATLMMHPQFLIARSSSWCVPKLKLVPTRFVKSLRWDEDAKASAIELLRGCENFILVSLFTAETQQEALSGNGTIHDFALHPETLKVLHASKSFWVS